MTKAIMTINDKRFLLAVDMTDNGFESCGYIVPPSMRCLILCTTAEELSYSYEHEYRCQLINELLLDMINDLWRTALMER